MSRQIWNGSVVLWIILLPWKQFWHDCGAARCYDPMLTQHPLFRRAVAKHKLEEETNRNKMTNMEE